MPDPHPSASRGQFLLLGCAGFASMASMRICDTMLPELARSFQVSTGTAAGAISMFAIAYGILQLVYGPLGDRYGKQRVIFFAVSACALFNLALAFAPSIPVLVALRGLSGAAAAGIIPLSMAFIGDSVAYEERLDTLARFLSATIAGMIFGQWVGGLFADTLGWHAAFVLLALLFGCVAVLMRRGAAASPRGAARQGYMAQVGGIVRIAWARRILAAVLVEGAFAYSAFVFIPTHLHDRFGLPLVAAGGIVVMYGVGGLCYTMVARRLVRRIGERGMAAGGGAMMAVGFAALAAGPHWVWAVPACLVAGFGFYMMHNTLQANATQMAPQARGTAVSLFASSLFLGQSLGISGVAALIDRSGTNVAFVPSLAVLPLLGAGLAWAMARRNLGAPRRDPPAGRRR